MSGAILNTPAATGPSTSDPLKSAADAFSDAVKAIGDDVKQGQASGKSVADEVLNAIGVKPETPPSPDDKKGGGVVVLVIGALFLLGAAAVVVYVVRRARK